MHPGVERRAERENPSRHLSGLSAEVDSFAPLPFLGFCDSIVLAFFPLFYHFLEGSFVLNVRIP